jgi:hypothetical protein
MRHDQQLSKEEMFDYLARLSRVGRINEFSSVPSDRVQYLNSFAAKDPKASLEKLITGAPEDSAQLSLAFEVKANAAPLRIARFSDTISDDIGQTVKKYDTKSQAFAAGEDIFIDTKLQPHINPESSSIRRVPRPGESRILTNEEEAAFRKTGKLPDDSDRLTGAPLYFNVLSGEVKSTARAVVGDLAPIADAAKLLNRDARGRVTGIKVGDFSSTQYVESGFAYHELSSLDANARYVWAKLRGLEKGDIINYNDLPMLEEIHRNWYKDGGKALKDLGIQLRRADGGLEDLVKQNNAASFESYLQRQKDIVISELLGDGSKNVDAAEVAIKANVSQKYIENGLVDTGQAGDKSLWMRPIEDSLRTNHVRLEYDIGDKSIQEGNILRGLIDVQYRIQMAKDQAMNAAVNYFGKDWEKFVVGDFTSADANILGAGPSAFGFANAEYRTLGQRAEGVGSNVATHMQERRSYVSDNFTSDILSLRADPEAAAELAIVTNIGRRIARRYTFLPEEVAAKYKVGPHTMVLEDSISRDAATGAITGWNKHYIPQEGTWFSGSRFARLDKTPEGAFTYYELSEKTANFLRTSTRLNDERLVHLNNWNAAQGIAKSYDLGSVYFPPVDTTRYKYVALVREIEGKGFGTSDAAALVADSAESLQKKVALLGDGYRISFKGTSKDYHEALGDYDYAMNLVESSVDSSLRKKVFYQTFFRICKGRSSDKGIFRLAYSSGRTANKKFRRAR